MNSFPQKEETSSKQQKNTNLDKFFYIDSYGFIQVVKAENIFQASRLIRELKNFQ